MTERKLTNKQARFVEEYLVDLNATQAAIRAGYAEGSARQIAAENMAKPVISAMIAEAQAQMAERTEITADRVLQEMALIGFADMGDYIKLNPDGTTEFDWSDLPSGATRVVSEITQETVRLIPGDGEGDLPQQVVKTKFKLHDKQAALVNMGRHLGMWNDKAAAEVHLHLAPRDPSEGKDTTILEGFTVAQKAIEPPLVQIPVKTNGSKPH